MKIGLVGVPGSGKSALAEKLHLAHDKGPTIVIDDYVSLLEKRFDCRYGEFATYIGNLDIAFFRLNAEREADIDASLTPRITCGTIIDTLAYMVVETAATEPYDGFQRRMLSSLALAGCLYHDTISYDIVAFLPAPAEASTFVQHLDDALAQTMEQFDTNPIVLTADPAEQLAAILNKVHELELAPTN